MALAASYFLGVDGGGTQCRARLESADGRVLGAGLSGPASMRFGFDAARDAIMTATRQALSEASLSEDILRDTYAGVGLAGTGAPGAREALEAWKHPFAGAWFEGDGYVAFLGAFGGAEGGVVIAGTGSIGLAYLKETIRVGGYGFPVSDEGSGADIGLAAVRHALRTLDGRARAGAFTTEILERFSDLPAGAVVWAENAKSTDYAALAPIVARHAAAGDADAARLMRNSGLAVGRLVDTLFAKGAPRVALIGGLSEVIQPYMEPNTVARLSAPQADALAGGILLARTRSASAGPAPTR